LGNFFFGWKQDFPVAESHETNPRGIEITKVGFASPNKVFFICTAKELNIRLKTALNVGMKSVDKR